MLIGIDIANTDVTANGVTQPIKGKFRHGVDAVDLFVHGRGLCAAFRATPGKVIEAHHVLPLFVIDPEVVSQSARAQNVPYALNGAGKVGDGSPFRQFGCVAELVGNPQRVGFVIALTALQAKLEGKLI